MSVIESIVLLVIGLLVGVVGTAWLERRWREKMKRQHNEVMSLAKRELDEAQHELIVKQNVIDSQESRIKRLQQANKDLKKKNQEL